MKKLNYKSNTYCHYLSCKFIVYTDYQKFFKYKEMRKILSDISGSTKLDLSNILICRYIYITSFSDGNFFNSCVINKKHSTIVAKISKISSLHTLYIDNIDEIQSVLNFCIAYLNDISILTDSGKVLIIYPDYYLTNELSSQELKFFSCVEMTDEERLAIIKHDLISELEDLSYFQE